MDGFLNVNKPLGITSFDVIRTLNRIQPGVKMGHLGTLDPMATGVLPIALGKATRLIEYIDNRIKVYAARMVLGGISDTQDATGNITWLDSDPAEPEQIIQTAKSFIGVIQQIPPMYSAVHYQGQRLYQLARKGITVEVNPRQVEIYSLDITDISSNESGLIQVSFKVKCSEGTYIRTLCHDMGQKLATGAYMDQLIRVNSGVFRIEESYTPETIMAIGLESCLKPLDYPINKFPAMQLNEENYNRVCNGNSIEVLKDYESEIVRLYYQDNLAAIAKCCQGDPTILKPIKVFSGHD